MIRQPQFTIRMKLFLILAFLTLSIPSLAAFRIYNHAPGTQQALPPLPLSGNYTQRLSPVLETSAPKPPGEDPKVTEKRRRKWGTIGFIAMVSAGVGAALIFLYAAIAAGAALVVFGFLLSVHGLRRPKNFYAIVAMLICMAVLFVAAAALIAII